MEFPADLFVSPVKGDSDLIQFRYDFGVKALDGQQVVTETEDGDLIIEGYAAVFEGMDREGENFTDGAFNRGIKSFLKGQAGLCYHHKHDKLLGKVLDLREEEGKGLWMKARVDSAVKKHPELGVYYDQIKRGTLNALSVGGFFRRKLTEAGRKIVDMDFTEISVTPVPVHPGTNFAVVAGKALEDGPAVPPVADDDLPEGLEDIFDRFNKLFDRVESAKALPESHDPAAADHVSTLLAHSQKLRQAASFAANHSDHKGVKSHADAIESAMAEHEAKLHKLAAKVGPLPTAYV